MLIDWIQLWVIGFLFTLGAIIANDGWPSGWDEWLLGVPTILIACLLFWPIILGYIIVQKM